MSGAGAPDFFYREAQRLGYVARSAFKVFLLFLSTLFPHSLLTFPFLLLTNPTCSFCIFVIPKQKLLQIQKQYKLIKPGSSVLDLGCAPGAWLQVYMLMSYHQLRASMDSVFIG